MTQPYCRTPAAIDLPRHRYRIRFATKLVDVQCASCHMRGTTMERIIGFLYGLVAYLVFLGAFLYAIGFVTGLWVPKTIDTGPAGPAGTAFVIDLLLMSLFAVQHSVMARPGFKQWWTQFVPPSVERSTYVLLA